MSEQRVVVITGASSGLGEAMAESCVRAGYRVVLAARREDRLQALAARLDREKVLVAVTDVRRPEEIQRMVDAALSRFGRIDALVANAGVGKSQELVETSEETMQEILDVNALGVFRCVRAVLPHMLQRGSGHILTVSSVAGELPGARAVLYSASKGAVTAFTEALRREVEPRGIRVTVVLPGFIQSEMTEHNPFSMPPASVIGDLLVRLLRRPRKRAVFPRYYGALIWAQRLVPGLLDPIMRAAQAHLDRRTAAGQGRHPR